MPISAHNSYRLDLALFHFHFYFRMRKMSYALSTGFAPATKFTMPSIYSIPESQSALLDDGTTYLAVVLSPPSDRISLFFVLSALSTNKAIPRHLSLPDSIV